MKLTITYATPLADVAYQIEAALNSGGLHATATEDNVNTDAARPVRFYTDDEHSYDIDYACAIAAVAIKRWKTTQAAS